MPPPSADRWTLQGRVVSYQAGQPVAGARVQPQGGAAVTTDGNGRFTIGGDRPPPANPYLVTVDGGGHVARSVHVRWQPGSRDDVTIDLIPLAAPFSLDFYRELARGGLNQPQNLRPLQRLTEDPSFYIQTTDFRGVDVPADTLRVVREAIPSAVHEFSGGTLRAARIEEGREARPEAPGWINVTLFYDTQGLLCGRASIATTPGFVELAYGNAVCSCNSPTGMSENLVRHELGHVLGFSHVAGREHIMTTFQDAACAGRPEGGASALERYHAALVYHRPPGNTDPDRDPAQIALTGPAAGRSAAISCYFR